MLISEYETWRDLEGVNLLKWTDADVKLPRIIVDNLADISSTAPTNLASAVDCKSSVNYLGGFPSKSFALLL